MQITGRLKDLPSTWHKRLRRIDIKVADFCKEVGVSLSTYYGKNPTLIILDKIESKLQELEGR